MTTLNCDLIFDYSLRNYVNSRFEELVGNYNSACRKCNVSNLNSSYFCILATFLTVAAYTYVGGFRVIAGGLKVGMFVTNLRIFSLVGEELHGIFDILVSMQEVLPALVSVAKLLNLQTDVRHRMELARVKHDMWTAQREALLGNSEKDVPVVDLLPIVLDLEDFRYDTTISHVIHFAGKVSLDQGQFVAVVGEVGSGKATLLRLLSNSLLPPLESKTSIFIPAHLRIVNAAAGPLFFDGTLLKNLTFGIAEGHRDSDKDRVIGICRDKFKMEARVLKYLDSGHCHKWTEVFSGVECKLLMIARALIFNAEVITFHKPLTSLRREECEDVVNAFCQHVSQRGLLQKSDKAMRRPRTIFVSAHQESKLISTNAHQVLHLDKKGIRMEKLRKAASM
jgi:ABC-type multidrug transport system fused ATPase/permease subunit